MLQATPIQASVALMSDLNKSLYPYDDLDSFFAANPITLPTGENGTIDMGQFIEAYSSIGTGG
ncbi:MAG: hypothetical protein R2706_13925 [Acidimicrobiales bacterium]